MLSEHAGEDTYTFFIYQIYKSYTVWLFLRKYFPKPAEYACKALDKSKKIVQIICFINLQSYYYTQRKKTKPKKKGEGADSIQAAPSLLFSRCTVFSSRDKKV